MFGERRIISKKGQEYLYFGVFPQSLKEKNVTIKGIDTNKKLKVEIIIIHKTVENNSVILSFLFLTFNKYRNKPWSNCKHTIGIIREI